MTGEELDFIPLKRSFFNHDLWEEERNFSFAEAWLWLIKEASFKDRNVIISGKAIPLKRGQLVASRRFLEKAWKWSGTKVDKFINYLVSQNMVKKEPQEKASNITILTLVNYGFHNNPFNKKATEKSQEKTTEKPDESHEKAKSNSTSTIVVDTNCITTSTKDLDSINTGQKNILPHSPEISEIQETVPPPNQPKKERKKTDPAQKKEMDMQARRERGEVPHTAEVVETYFLEHQKGRWPVQKIQAEAYQFWCHYEANGWLQTNKKPIVKWQAAVGGWISRHNSGQFNHSDQMKGYSLQGQVAVKSDTLVRVEIETMYHQYLTNGDQRLAGFHQQHYEYLKTNGFTKGMFGKEATAQIETEAIKRRIETLLSGSPTLNEQHLADAYKSGNMESELVKQDEGKLTYLKRKLALLILFMGRAQQKQKTFFND